jgi:hypothetical protein
MTLTIELEPEVESRLQEESQRTGVPIAEVAGRILMERFQANTDRIGRLIASISAPIDIADTSRETIYAD